MGGNLRIQRLQTTWRWWGPWLRAPTPRLLSSSQQCQWLPKRSRMMTPNRTPLCARRYIKEGAKQTLNKPNCDSFNIWEHSMVSCYSWSCHYPMTWKISRYMDQSENWGCSIALLISWLICFALSFIYLLGVITGVLVSHTPSFVPTLASMSRSVTQCHTVTRASSDP